MEATRDARERRGRKPAGQTQQTKGQTSGPSRIAPGQSAKVPEGEETAGSEEDMANADEGGVEPENVTMVESTRPTTTATPRPTTTACATANGTSIAP